MSEARDRKMKRKGRLDEGKTIGKADCAQVLRSDGVLSALARQATYETANKKRDDV